MSRAHLWLSDRTKEVKGGQNGRAGAGRQLVNAVDNQMDEPILQGATFLLFCLLPHLTAALGHVPECLYWLAIYCEHMFIAHFNIP